MQSNLQFFSFTEGVADTYPIIPAKELEFKWVKLLTEDYKRSTERQHIRKCPGIFDILGTGYVVTLPWDINIRLDSKGFGYDLPGQHLPKITGTESLVGVHKNIPGIDRLVLKICTPWHVIANCKFAIIPIPYPDSNVFEACHGILDPEKSTELNAQVFWNKSGEVLLKAGTPLMQIIPLTEKKTTYTVRDATDKDKQWVNRRFYLSQHSFQYPYKLVREAYRNFFQKKF